jgi:hypothetical protein
VEKGGEERDEKREIIIRFPSGAKLLSGGCNMEEKSEIVATTNVTRKCLRNLHLNTES